ncbi:NAD(P)/FAD-dependent oxidoreductase [Rhodococcus rhodochrous]|uniref:Pyridine nucleotide-disulfide oxidoreductase n=1 Tax=Rhodococcus rhodochrous KG-21 TaxID=1441923 RepID=A0A0M8PMV2_RHORH|nr:FAD/NAD(P)-binding oxidoreductase [Rhodococcus rhodochrous]KOS58175.1 hypothetical protein Z051_00995 [Rhodococcus rhodochrous KG-21]
MTSKLVVVGASLAGLRAVEGARRSGFSGEIVLLGDEDRLPYDRPPLSKAVLTAATTADIAPLRTETVLRNELGVTLKLGTRATALDTNEKVVYTADDEIPYTAAVLATGCRARTLPDIGTHPAVHVLRAAGDALALRKALDNARTLVVIGAGFVGSEVASAARTRGIDVTIVESSGAPLAHAVGAEPGALLTQLHEYNGTRVLLNSTVTTVTDRKPGAALTLADGRVLEADLVLVAVGAIPNVEWLASSRLDITDGIICNADLGVGAPGLAAAGDICNWPDRRWGRRFRLEHWTNAAEQGAHAARTALSPDATEPFSAIPYFWSEWYGVKVQKVGRADCNDHLVIGDIDAGRYVVLYGHGGKLLGALTVGRPGETMKLRRLIENHTDWHDAVDFARKRATPPVGTAQSPV